MKQMKKLAALATGSMAIALLLGSGMAQAQLVCVNDDTVTGIKGLTVLTNQYNLVDIDVDFRYATAFDMYGSELENLPFEGIWAEADAFSVLFAINQTLSVAPVPDSAGPAAQNTYYIGIEKETEETFGALAVWGGANYTGLEWKPCEEEGAINCLLGAAVTPAADLFTYAALKQAVPGAQCDGSAPPEQPPSASITPGFSGSWFDQAREGEGFNIEIGGPELAPYLLTYFYTYDATGNQMWLTGFADISGSDTVVVDMTVTSGAVFGDDFDPTDVSYDPWGTITFQFSSCEAGTASYNSPEFGTGTFNLFHLTRIAGLSCP
jgi:hypothetical protein